MATLLEICQEVARKVGTNVPTVIVGSSDLTARRFLACAQDAGKYLARRPENGWIAMITEHTFNTADATIDYALPSDFNYIISDTVWDRTNFTETRGPLTPQEWQEYKSSVLATTATTWKKYRIRNVSNTKYFSIFPTPTAVEEMVFEYMSKGWCEDSGGTRQTSWAADTDVSVIDDWIFELELEWRFLRKMGLEFADEKKDARRELSKAVARDGGAPRLHLAGRREYRFITPLQVPDTGYGS